MGHWCSQRLSASTESNPRAGILLRRAPLEENQNQLRRNVGENVYSRRRKKPSYRLREVSTRALS
jgi:hypothetical protein